jgi:hypothetical protein
VNYNCQNNGVICGGLFPQNSHFETLTVGLNECVNNLPFGANIILNAHEFIQLNKNLNCPVGTELLLQTGMCH